MSSLTSWFYNILIKFIRRRSNICQNTSSISKNGKPNKKKWFSMNDALSSIHIGTWWVQRKRLFFRCTKLTHTCAKHFFRRLLLFALISSSTITTNCFSDAVNKNNTKHALSKQKQMYAHCAGFSGSWKLSTQSITYSQTQSTEERNDSLQQICSICENR